MDINAAREKVAKLINLAENNAAGENEANTAIRQAEKLMQKYGIDRSEIFQKEGKVSYEWESSFYPFGREGKPTRKVPVWFQWLAVQVAKFTDTIVEIGYDYQVGVGVKFKGHQEDVILACWFADYLKECIRRETRAAEMGSSRGREDFRKAMSLRLCARMRDMIAQRTQVFSSSTALVVVNDKLSRRDKFFGSPAYREGRGLTRVSHEAVVKGTAAADRVNFNTPLNS